MIDRITEVLRLHYAVFDENGHINGTVPGRGAWDCWCGGIYNTTLDTITAHVAEKIATELADEIPEREFVDEFGRQWEWCGGQPGTWAWRVTAIVRQPTPSCKCTPESCRIDCSACTLHTFITGRGCIAKITGYPGEAADVDN